VPFRVLFEILWICGICRQKCAGDLECAALPLRASFPVHGPQCHVDPACLGELPGELSIIYAQEMNQLNTEKS
jgi:hypothetical protein